MKPRILILADKPDWALDFQAQALRTYLSDQFDLEIAYALQKPVLFPERTDALIILWWGERYHQRFGFDPRAVIKQISSHRWVYQAEYACASTEEMAFRNLLDCKRTFVPSRRLYNDLYGVAPSCSYVTNGFISELFQYRPRTHSGLIVGYAGNKLDPFKGFSILEEACNGQPYALKGAGGGLSRDAMPAFYNNIDVFACSSNYEGEPHTLLEAMACGCFPVSTDVGIATELIQHGQNGLIVRSQTMAAFREAFDWCYQHQSQVKRAGRRNAEMVLERGWSWESCANGAAAFIQTAISEDRNPLFRNDDVGPDTDVGQLVAFCEVFHKRGFRQIHGVNGRGKVGSRNTFRQQPAEYQGHPSISLLPNEVLRRLSDDYRLEDCSKLVDFLQHSDDEIALHGLYHIDYSIASCEEQERELSEGLRLLGQLFPKKPVKRFIPPFNRFNMDTWRLCRQLGLELMVPYGMHLEQAIHFAVNPVPNGTYRYHHHRFYSDSHFREYSLTLPALDAYLSRIANPDAGDRKKPMAMVPQPSLARRTGRFGKRVVRGTLRRIEGAASSVVGMVDTVTAPARGLPLRLTSRIVKDAVMQTKADPWFVYAHSATRVDRPDICLTREWIAANRRRTDRILELGCGAGLNLHWLARHGFRHCEGWDQSGHAIAAAQAIAKRTHYTPVLMQRDILNIERPKYQFDVIISVIVTYLNEHFELGAFLQCYREYLRDGGVMVLDCIDKAYDLVNGNQYHTDDWSQPEYLRRRTEYKVRYSEDEVRTIAHSSGLNLQAVLVPAMAPPKKIYIFDRP